MNKWYKILGILIITLICQYSVSQKYMDENNAENKKSAETITFISNRVDKEKELKELIAEYESTHNNVKINLELIGNAEEILSRKLSIGELPDVTLIPEIIHKDNFSKYFIPIDDIGISKENMYNYELGVGDDGRLYGISTSLIWNGIIYNKEIFEEAGITKTPENEEELWEACSKIKNIGITPIVINYKQPWTMNMWLEKIPLLYNINYKENLIEDIS